MITDDAKFVKLVKSFPVLRDHAPGLTETTVDLLLLDRWAAHTDDLETLEQIHACKRNPYPGSGAIAAAQFVLSVWSDSYEWRAGKFNMLSALHVWDEYQKKAFRQWVICAWRP